jgi:hypothetical protein
MRGALIMGKVKFRNMPLVYPLPAILVGAMVNGKPNYITLGNCFSSQKTYI